MKNLFDLDNPFIQFLMKVGDLILVNFLFLICCVPIVTVGAALAALHKVTQNIVLDQERGTFKTFFQAMRENFRQATGAWLVMLVFFICMGCNLLLITTFFTGNTATVLYWIVGFLAAFVLSMAAYLFPLIVRYQNTLHQHCRNAVILSVVKLPRTVVMVFVNVLPFLIAYVSMQVLFKTLVFWLVIGFAFASYISAHLLAPVFKELEKDGGAGMQIMT